MKQEDWTHRGHDTRARAVERVDAAVVERSRLSNEHESAKGTSGELQSDVLLRAAKDEVVARDRWLQWVEERNY